MGEGQRAKGLQTNCEYHGRISGGLEAIEDNDDDDDDDGFHLTAGRVAFEMLVTQKEDRTEQKVLTIKTR